MHALTTGPMAFRTLNDAVSHWAAATPDALALTFLEDGAQSAMTYGQLHQRSLGIAQELTMVSRPGDRAVLVFDQGLDYVVAFLACSYAGVVAVTGASPDELRKAERLVTLVADSGAEIVLTNTQAAGKLSVLDRLDKALFVVNTDLSDVQALDAPLPASDSDLMFLQYTSGSTSAPKGVMLTHHSIVSNLEAIRKLGGMHGQSVHVSWLPLYHDMGLIFMTLSALYCGRPLYLMSPTDFLRHPLSWLEAISKYKATMTAAPDFAYRLCLEAVTPQDLAKLDLSSLQVMANGAEPIRVNNAEAFFNTFKPTGLRRGALMAGYGMAEVGVLITIDAMLDQVTAFDARALEEDRVATPCDRRAPGSRLIAQCGVVDPHLYDLRIVHPEHLTELEAGQVGEIWLSGASVGAGYWDNPKATRAAFKQKLPGHEQSYLRTGDLGFLFEGRLHICGRHKEMMIVRGRNLFPADVCEIVETATPAMKGRRAAAFSLEGEQGEEVVIVCAARVEADTVNEVAREIMAAVTKGTGVAPAGLLFVDNRVLKRTTSGKVRHGTLRQDFIQGNLETRFKVMSASLSSCAEVPASPQATPQDTAHEPPDWIVQMICETCATICKCPPLGKHDNLFEMGLDSLRAMRLISALETHLDKAQGALNLSDIVELKTPRNIAQALVTPWFGKTAQQGQQFVEMSV